MASTKKINSKPNKEQLQKIKAGLMTKVNELNDAIANYESQANEPFSFIIKRKPQYDEVNPDYYKQEDGKQTWERMIDEYGVEATATFCEINAFKYKERLGKKITEKTELDKEKMEWYNNKAVELREQLKEQHKKKYGFFG